MHDTFVHFSVLILVVLGISVIMRLLKQPLIIGYIISGILIGPSALNLLRQNELMGTFSDFGISFLLFIVGLHLNPKVIREVGKISLITGVGQVIFTSLIGYFISLLLGFSAITSIYIAIALTFSSTIIIMKLLSDKDALEKLYGKISIGFLLVQDLIAILILIVVSSFSEGSSVAGLIGGILLKGTLLIGALGLISAYALPRLSGFFARSQELLFIFALSWGLGLASLFYFAGFSIEVGALIAGIMLSISPYSYEIGSKLKPLRDFFIISFFLILGSQMVFADIARFIIPVILFSAFILIGNPLIVMALMGFFGYSKKTGFMAGLTVAQISEFSLILIALGAKKGHLSGDILSFVTLIGLITIAGSTYLIMYSDLVYSKIKRHLSLFERKKVKEKEIAERTYDSVLFGYNRIGFSILKSFAKVSRNRLVIDFDPNVIDELKKKGIAAAYGDVDDIESMDEIRLDQARIAVSTIPEIETNMVLLKMIREKNKDAVVIVTARQIADAFELYSAGADYVILPHFLGGQYTADIIGKAKTDRKRYEPLRRKQMVELKERAKEGQEHPMTK